MVWRCGGPAHPGLTWGAVCLAAATTGAQTPDGAGPRSPRVQTLHPCGRLLKRRWLSHGDVLGP